MAFIPKDWKNEPDPSTPVSAEALEDAEVRLSAFGEGEVATEKGRAEAAEGALSTALGAKAPLASPAFTGNPTALTQAPGDSSTRLATTAFVATSFAPLASPSLTGTPLAPTAVGGTNTTQIATTAFVTAAVSTAIGGIGSVASYVGGSTSAGEGALEKWPTLSSTERGVHVSNTAFGYHALNLLTGLNGTFNITSETATGATQLNLTGVEAKAATVWAGGTSNTPIVIFKKLTAGQTGLKTNQAYFVVNGLANSFAVSLARNGAAVKVEGANIKTDTEVTLLFSTEDNTAFGYEAGRSLTTGGGNTLIGEHAGANLTTGEENTVLGCETLAAQTSQSSNVALGFRAGGSNKTGSGLVILGTQALESATASSEMTIIGHKAMQEGAGGARATALGFEALKKSAGSSNTALGALAGKSLTTGGFNTLVGVQSGNSLSTGGENVFVGYNAGAGTAGGGKNVAFGEEALFANVAGERNVALGYAAGEGATGSSNIFIGNHAGGSLTAVSNRLVIASQATMALIEGTMGTTTASQEIGFLGAAPVKQASAIASPAETVASLKTAVDALRVVVKNLGFTA